MAGDGGDEPRWWNRPEAEVGHDVESKRREAFKWICVAVFVAVAVIFGVFAAVQSYRTLAHDQQAAEASDSGDESGESGDASDDATDSASSDETGGIADQDSSQTYDRGLRDLAACGRPGYFVLTTGDAGKPVARLENTGSTYTSMNEYVNLQCLTQQLGYTGTNIIHDLGDNESWNNSMNWVYATEGDTEFNDADDSAYRKEYSTPKWIGDGTYKVKCFDEDHRSICDFYMTGNTPTPAEMMKDQYKGNSNAVGYDQYRSYNCSAGNSGKLTPCSTIYQEMENGTMQYLPFGIENASDPDDASTYIPVDTDRDGLIDGGEAGH
ncbi:hypothetical protein Uis1B_0208 [Bifidobacterium margollesii]|uniref:Uncharacterized protein n=2 Tax=Bifidobacterium margollesii TaxID=2020964 RepID=A0A2N5JD62_9BIFI|nr:hypothetical protein Uis1B_0208 [Bifidobacterium margollesii]